jgi:hypothetical protein
LGNVGANISAFGAIGRGGGDIVHVDSKVQHSRASLSVELAVPFLTEERVDECMLVSGMKALSRSEDMKFVSGVRIRVKEGFEVKVRDTAFTLRGCQSAELFCCYCINTDFILSSGHLQWYCLTRSGECTFIAGSHILSLSGYPFHFRRYCNCLECPCHRWLQMASTLYCSSPLTRSGGGWE